MAATNPAVVSTAAVPSSPSSTTTTTTEAETATRQFVSSLSSPSAATPAAVSSRTPQSRLHMSQLKLSQREQQEEEEELHQQQQQQQQQQQGRRPRACKQLLPSGHLHKSREPNDSSGAAAAGGGGGRTSAGGRGGGGGGNASIGAGWVGAEVVKVGSQRLADGTIAAGNGAAEGDVVTGLALEPSLEGDVAATGQQRRGTSSSRRGAGVLDQSKASVTAAAGKGAEVVRAGVKGKPSLVSASRRRGVLVGTAAVPSAKVAAAEVVGFFEVDAVSPVKATRAQNGSPGGGRGAGGSCQWQQQVQHTRGAEEGYEGCGCLA